MNKSILLILEEKAPSFSKGQKQIARYILSDLQKAAFLTAAALGKETEVSESTVVRFATELGYEGFPQMQKALQDALVDRFRDKNPGSDVQTLQKETLAKVAQALRTARRIYLLAQGQARVLSDYVAPCLERLFADVHILTPDSPKMGHIGAGDVVFAFTFPPYSNEVAENVAFCRNAGAKVVGITNSENAPIYPDCAYCLFANAENKSFGVSFLRPMALMEELLEGLTSGKEDGACEI